MNTPKKPGPGAYGPISTRHQSPPPITRPELRAAFKAHGIEPRTATPEERETARQLPAQRSAEPMPEWVSGSLLPILERMAEREEDRRGRRDSIADASDRATDAAGLAKKATTEAAIVLQKLGKWWKVAALVIGFICTAGAGCGATIFGYLSASKANAANTEGVADKAAEKAIKEAPKPIERERVIYVERAAAPLPSGSVYVPQIQEGEMHR